MSGRGWGIIGGRDTCAIRELRGKIFRTLAEKPATLTALKRVCDNDSRMKEALDALTKDKLTKYEKRNTNLPSVIYSKS